MTDIKGSALPSASSLSLTDLILVIINPGTSPETRNATLSVLATALAGSVAGTLTAGDDPRVTGAVQASTLGDAAFADFGNTAGTACAGDDTRVANAQLYTWASFSNADYPAQYSDRFIAQIGSMSAAHTVTLPAANALNPGETIVIIDISGTVSSTNKINVAVSGSDTINGTSSHAIIQPYEQVSYTSDGTSTWTRSGNHYGMTPVGDADYTALPTDKVIMLTTTFTAARTVTLPAVSTVPLGYEITIQDANSVINPNSGFNLVVARSGSDTINGSTSQTFSIARSGITFRAYSNGWKYDAGALRKTSSQVKLADGWSVNNTNTTLPSQTRYADVFALTGPITVTLPAAANVPYNQNILIADTSGNCSPTNTITVQAAGTDKLNGVTSGTYVIAQPYGQLLLTSNGSSFYTYSGSELKVKNNLSDVASALTARTNLGLGTAATQNTGTFVQVANNLSDVVASTARTNLGIDTVATCKSNLTATTDPGVSNDNTQGYAVGSLWVNNTSAVAWIATAVGTGAAKWAKATTVLPDVQIFNTAGSFTWTKPANATTVRVYGIGAGGGGGSGRKGAAGTVRCGGGGGGGGGFGMGEFRASDLNATETVTVGAGGAGGIAQTTNSTNGNGGSNGGATWFKGANFCAFGVGSGASGGTATTGTQGAGGFSFSSGGAGASASTTGAAGAGPGSAGIAASGGAPGGGLTSADAQSAGGTGGSGPAMIGFWAGGTPGSSGGGNGGNAPNATAATATSSPFGAPGGGGGGSNLTGNGGNGGNGGNPGGGGGGGGAAVDSVGNSGAGGTGGNGLVVVISV